MTSVQHHMMTFCKVSSYCRKIIIIKIYVVMLIKLLTLRFVMHLKTLNKLRGLHTSVLIMMGSFRSELSDPSSILCCISRISLPITLLFCIYR